MDEIRLITQDNVTASFGLSADEVIGERVGTGESVPTLRLYTYKSHCGLVGRFQNIQNELRLDFCKENNITVNRRPTGGGAIIMGDGQLGLALMLPGQAEDTYSRARELMLTLSDGIIKGLNELGVNAQFYNKNDILVNGRKIVGTGIHRAHSGSILFHASTLVDLDIKLMLQVLNTPLEKISDKQVAAISERLTNVRGELGRDISVDEVRQAIARNYASALNVKLVPETYTDAELEAIAKVEKEKYLSDEWIYQTSTVEDKFGGAKFKTPVGLLDIRVALAGQTLKAVYIGGDFFAEESAVAEMESSMRWHTSQADKVTATLERVYKKREKDFNGLPFDAIRDTVMKAVANAEVVESQPEANPYGQPGA
ncbi:MAG: lipoate--protein ligase family protein [Anaerolineales bacterium]|nr:lipoate--protein ligase family protein [Anaerolineales bacterium]